MLLSNFSIKQPVTTVAIIIVLMCLGLLALTHLRVNQIPDVDMPIMVVQFPYPGASPESVERDSSTASRSRCRAFRRSTSCVPPPRMATRSS